MTKERRKPPTLAESLAWYSQQAADEANSPEEREQWEALAAELRPRVEGKQVQDSTLWEET